MHTAVANRQIGRGTFDLDEYVYAALRAGARGFLLKDPGRPCWSRRCRPRPTATP
jgi:hypothetical protein